MRILIVLIGLFALNFTGAEQNNFKINNKAVEYSRIYYTDSTVSDSALLLFINSINGFKYSQTISQRVLGTLSGVPINYQGIGYSYWTTWVGLNYPLKCDVIIDIKPGRYRVILRNIFFENKTVSYSLKSLIKADGKQFRSNSTTKKALFILDTIFAKKFLFTAEKEW